MIGAELSADMAKYFAAWGVERPGTTQEGFAARYRAEVEKFAKIIREARIPLVD